VAVAVVIDLCTGHRCFVERVKLSGISNEIVSDWKNRQI
jgi:hypothetical protein